MCASMWLGWRLYVSVHLISCKIISISNNTLTLDIEDYDPAKIIKELSNLINIIEFRKKSMTLNNLFLSLVEE